MRHRDVRGDPQVVDERKAERHVRASPFIEPGAGTVVAMDGDHDAVDALYLRRSGPLRNIVRFAT